MKGTTWIKADSLEEAAEKFRAKSFSYPRLIKGSKKNILTTNAELVQVKDDSIPIPDFVMKTLYSTMDDEADA